MKKKHVITHFGITVKSQQVLCSECQKEILQVYPDINMEVKETTFMRNCKNCLVLTASRFVSFEFAADKQMELARLE